jgi:hypothetical protein
VAGRLPGAAHRVFEPGDRRHQGSFRIGCDDLRILAAMMTNGEARVLVCLVLPCDRDKHGAPRRAADCAEWPRDCFGFAGHVGARCRRRYQWIGGKIVVAADRAREWAPCGHV